MSQQTAIASDTKQDYRVIPTPHQVSKTADAVRSRGIQVEVFDTRAEALEYLKRNIPAGSTVMTGSSITLKDIGFEDLLIVKPHPWQILKDEIVAETDSARQSELRRNSILADYWLGSVHAIAETGEIVVASATGSQLPAYTFSSLNVIKVAGTQKIEATRCHPACTEIQLCARRSAGEGCWLAW